MKSAQPKLVNASISSTGGIDVMCLPIEEDGVYVGYYIVSTFRDKDMGSVSWHAAEPTTQGATA
jgi:hypothetical protein